MKRFVLFSILFVSCKIETPIAEVGESYIYKKDLEDFQKIQIAYGAEFDEEENLLQLIQRFIDIEIAKAEGIEITERDIIEEENRIIKNTRESDILSRIYNMIGDRKRVREIFIKPIVARKKIEEKFFYDSLFYQREIYDKAKEKLKILKSEVPALKDSTFFHFNPGDTSIVYEYLVKEVIKNVNKDTIYKIFEDKFTYYPLKIIKKRKGLEISGFNIQKRDFYDDFYFKKLEKIQVLVYNKTLKSKILKRVRKTRWEEIIR